MVDALEQTCGALHGPAQINTVIDGQNRASNPRSLSHLWALPIEALRANRRREAPFGQGGRAAADLARGPRELLRPAAGGSLSHELAVWRNQRGVNVYLI